MATENKKYKRVMLKLSGEAMASDKGFVWFEQGKCK